MAATSDNVPLLRVRYAAAFADALRAKGIPLAPLLKKAGIDEGILDVREAYMPVSQLGKFAAYAAQSTGIAELGLIASLAPRISHSDFSTQILCAPTLNQSLQAACTMAKTEDLSATLFVVKNGSLAWFCASRVDGSPEEIRQIELYRYGGLLQMIRYTAGPDWVPKNLKLQCIDDGKLRDVPLIFDADVHFGAANLAIGFPVRMLAETPWYGGQQSARIDNCTYPVPALNENLSFDQAAKEVVRTHLLAHRMKVADVARSLGMSTRSFQRKLAEHSVTFAELLEHTRLELARSRLAESSASFAEIAVELGFTHATHFSRAFRRACGISPREYRKSFAEPTAPSS
jgi:AraC-like DNA-binding protein